MKTKIGLPFGLALVMFLGIFTTMLALGALSPSKAQAVTGGFDVTLSNTIPGHFSDWSFSVKSANDFMGVDPTASPAVDTATTLTITFPDDVSLSGTGVISPGNWMLGGKPATAALGGTGEVVLTPQAAAAASGDDAAVPAFMIKAEDPIKVEFTAPMKGPTATGEDEGIQNPAATVAEADRTDQTISVVTSEDSTPGVSEMFSFDNTRVGQVEVTNDPTEPGSENAEYQITFYVPEELTANQDRIIVRFDKDIGSPSSISANHVRIRASVVTDDDGANPNIAGNAIALVDAPTRGLVNSMGRAGDEPGDKNIVEYKLRIPDLDTDPDRPQAGIGAHAMVTVTFSSSAGFKNPTEAGKGDVVSVATSKQDVFVSDNIVVPLILEIDDVKDKRDTPLTITGKGFKNGTTAIIWVEKTIPASNKFGVRDANEIDIVPVEVASDDTFEITVNVALPPFSKGPNNYINAIDGEEPKANTFTDMKLLPKFEVEQSIVISPSAANVGDTIRV